MKICLRYPYPKSFPSGKGLTIASLKLFEPYLFFDCFLLLVLGMDGDCFLLLVRT